MSFYKSLGRDFDDLGADLLNDAQEIGDVVLDTVDSGLAAVEDVANYFSPPSKPKRRMVRWNRSTRKRRPRRGADWSRAKRIRRLQGNARLAMRAARLERNNYDINMRADGEPMFVNPVWRGLNQRARVHKSKGRARRNPYRYRYRLRNRSTWIPYHLYRRFFS